MSQVVVHSEFKDAAGRPLTGTLTFEPAKSWADGLAVVATPTITVPANGDVTLEASAIPYVVTERIDGAPEKRYMVLLDGVKTTVALSDLKRGCVTEYPVRCSCGCWFGSSMVAFTVADADIRYQRNIQNFDPAKDFAKGSLVYLPPDAANPKGQVFFATSTVKAGTAVPPALPWQVLSQVPGPQGPPGPPGGAGSGGGAVLSDTPPLADGVAAPGTGAKASREDHVHPSPLPATGTRGQVLTLGGASGTPTWMDPTLPTGQSGVPTPTTGNNGQVLTVGAGGALSWQNPAPAAPVSSFKGTVATASALPAAAALGDTYVTVDDGHIHICTSVGPPAVFDNIGPASGGTLPTAAGTTDNGKVLAVVAGVPTWQTPNQTLAGLTDTQVNTPADGQTLYWDGTNNRWFNMKPSLNNRDIWTDVDAQTTAPTDGQVLSWVAADGKWKPSTYARPDVGAVEVTGLQGKKYLFWLEDKNTGLPITSFPADPATEPVVVRYKDAVTGASAGSEFPYLLLGGPDLKVGDIGSVGSGPSAAKDPDVPDGSVINSGSFASAWGWGTKALYVLSQGTSEVRAVYNISKGLPSFTLADSGKQLTVVNGAPAWQTNTPELPPYATADDGKQLTVRNDGTLEWKTDAPELPPYATADAEKALHVAPDGTVAWKYAVPIVVKATQPVAADYGEAAIPNNAVWLKKV